MKSEDQQSLATNPHTSGSDYAADDVIDDAAAEIRIEAVIKVSATVEYDTGSGLQTATFDMKLMPFDNGDVYAWPTKDVGVSQTALDNLGELHAITVNSLQSVDGAEGDNLV